jgi:hypothetical protein
MIKYGNERLKKEAWLEATTLFFWGSLLGASGLIIAILTFSAGQPKSAILPVLLMIGGFALAIRTDKTVGEFLANHVEVDGVIQDKGAFSAGGKVPITVQYTCSGSVHHKRKDVSVALALANGETVTVICSSARPDGLVVIRKKLASCLADLSSAPR